MTAAAQERRFIPDLEIPDAQVKWAWSNIAGRKNDYDSEGDHYFQIIIPEDRVNALLDDGWAVKEHEGQEEGDPPEYLLKVRVSYRFDPPKVYFLKGRRKIRAEERDLPDITRASTNRLDLVLQPSRWVKNGRTGISAYVKEMYVDMKTSQFDEMYADYEEV